ncbi:exodeoxyribonuclease V subunit alpha [Microlunatus sp. Gsoil 973]|uniref:exodeoxyribonuclease V subunit alpha n=1 Tax=Microlunatus sp. Gsoil 973 TaxID=2672569 RepID=UPI0012B4F100|nr:exodeoxyribonuclease V subunit alpha [Microlunatus sp. Gsoil 973]QGN32194.1 exodeoxyribonuclease V subunit alpha [Microlunatus sp. Gsoil 973]
MTVASSQKPALDDAQLAHAVGGLLGEFNRAGVLGVADVHAARSIGRIGGEARESVILAVALAVRALRAGSVCIDLRTVADAVFADTAADDATEQVDVSSLDWPDSDRWMADCRDSPLVTTADGPDGRPLRMAGGLLYLERYWRQEESVRLQLQQRSTAGPPTVDLARLRSGLERIFTAEGLDPDEPDLQRRAAAMSVLRWISVLAGGPGTGKTTTVARLIALLHDQHTGLGDPHGTDPDGHTAVRRPLRVALAAPTGKAAARLEEAVRDAARKLPMQDRERIGDLGASTVHRLLGWTPEGRNRFRHNGFNRLPYDVVVVDEMSMVPLTLMARLLEALRPDARLILVGDPDQLASVEAGAVLADIVNAEPGPDTGLATTLAQVLSDPPQSATALGVVRLQHTWRFGGVIGELARAIRASEANRVIEILRSQDPALVFSEPNDPSAAGEASIDMAALDALRREVVGPARMIKEAAESGDVAAALAGLEEHRLLCAHRRGPYGVTRWTREILRWLGEAIPGYATGGEWYPGRPLLITANDYETSLYNGDTGVVVQTANGLRAAFARGGSPTLIAPVRLDAVQSVHAMTVHRAQGSQFHTVSFVVPPPDSPLLTRELLYTAVTRATERVIVLGTEEAVRRAILRPANRASGLRSRL